MKTNNAHRRSRAPRALAAAFATFSLFALLGACEDPLTAVAAESVRLAGLPDPIITITNDGNGSTSPSGDRTVSSGVATSITATANPTWVFNGWTKTSGTGTVTFGNASNASTTISIIEGEVTVRANFRKEVLTFTEVASLAFNAGQSTYPSDARALFIQGDYLFVLGYAYTTGTSTALRRINISNPTTPTSGNNDYKYVEGHGNSLTGNPTYVLVGSESNIFFTDPFASNFSAATISAPNPAIPVRYLDADSNDLYFWALKSSGHIQKYAYNNFSSTQDLIDYVDNWDTESFFRASGGILLVQEDNGANQVAGYTFTTIGNQPSSPDSSTLLHDGADMDPGWAGWPAPDSARKYYAVPVIDKNSVVKLPVYDASDLTDLPGSLQGTATLSGSKVNDAFYGNNYIYVAGVNDSMAYVSLVDATDCSNLVVRKTMTITGFDEASQIHERDGYLYVLVDTSAGAPVLKIYSITSN